MTLQAPVAERADHQRSRLQYTGSAPMPAHQCRLNAERCLQLAKRAQSPQARQNFIDLAERLTTLAAQLESDEALLSALSELEVSKPRDALALTLKLRSWPTNSNKRRRIHASNRAF